jgi:aldehyde:ferredoxin oxidoreductase
MLDEIEKGTEFGTTLANGVVSTCKALGLKRIPAFKNQGIPAHDPRVGKGTGVTYHTSPMGADHTAGLCYGGDFMNNDGAVDRSLVEQIFGATRDALGYCYFATPMDHKKTMEFLKDLINARYGSNVSVDDLIKIGRDTLKDEIEFNKKSGFHTLNEPDPEFVRTEPVAPLGNVFGVDPGEMAKIWDKLDTIQVV